MPKQAVLWLVQNFTEKICHKLSLLPLFFFLLGYRRPAACIANCFHCICIPEFIKWTKYPIPESIWMSWCILSEDMPSQEFWLWWVEATTHLQDNHQINYTTNLMVKCSNFWNNMFKGGVNILWETKPQQKKQKNKKMWQEDMLLFIIWVNWPFS